MLGFSHARSIVLVGYMKTLDSTHCTCEGLGALRVEIRGGGAGLRGGEEGIDREGGAPAAVDRNIRQEGGGG